MPQNLGNTTSLSKDLIAQNIDKLFTLLPELIYVWDFTAKKLTYVSPKFQEVLGEFDIEAFEAMLVSQFEHLHEGNKIKFAFDFKTQNGAVRNLESTGTLLNDQSSENKVFLLIAQDVTEQKEYEEQFVEKITQLQRQSVQMDEAESILKFGSWEWNLNHNSIKWSEGLFNILAIESSRFYNQTVERGFYSGFVVEEDRESVLKFTEEILNGNKIQNELPHKIIDAKGNKKNIILRARSFYDQKGVVIKVLGVCADVTQLELYKRELELQLEKANNSNLELEQFAYIASHDLQEPLRKITAFGERLEKNYRATLGDDGQFYLNRMTNAAQRMNILVEDLLKYSRASRKTEGLTKISLNDVLKNVLEVLELKINEKKAIVKIASLPSVEAQPTQMLQLFQNLIENALKFSKNDVQPRIEIDSVELMGGQAQHIKSLIPEKKYYKIRVTDNGIGFEPKNKENIFTIFQRLHGRSEYEGTGIGLAICRKIVEANGGKIIAESDQNQGAVFIIYLPT